MNVVLLSILIAQMNATYRKIQGDVEGSFAIARARIIARLQKGNMWMLCKRKVRDWHVGTGPGEYVCFLLTK